MSDGGGFSKTKVSFSGIAQSFPKRFLRNYKIPVSRPISKVRLFDM